MIAEHWQDFQNCSVRYDVSDQNNRVSHKDMSSKEAPCVLKLTPFNSNVIYTLDIFIFRNTNVGDQKPVE